MPRRLASVLLLAAAVSGCGGSSAPASDGGGVPNATLSAPADCSTASPVSTPGGPSRPLSWSSAAPAGMPKPPGIVVLDSSLGSDGVRVVKAASPTTLRQAVLFIVHELPPAGFVLGHGDAEATEADAPFQHGDVHGLIRLEWTGGCQTQWLIATSQAQQNGSPLLPEHSESVSPSPLSFG